MPANSTVTSCRRCGLGRRSCTCSQCPSCQCRFLSTDMCQSCNRCMTNGCCECRQCYQDGCTIRSSNRRFMCSRCGKCLEHCRCYTCITCNVRFDGDQRNGNNWCSNCGNCASHCRCYSCNHRDRYTENRCTHRGNCASICISCAKCSEHCRCVVCNICERLSDNNHSACGSCSRCCSCSAIGVRLRDGKLTFHNSVFVNGEFKDNKLRRHLSTELEVDIYNMYVSSTEVNNTINKWRDPVMRDGSINEGGFEILTNPSNGNKFLEHIKQITNGLAKISASCSESCGLHVHVNVNGDLVLDKQGKIIFDERTGKPLFDKRTAYTQYDLRRLINLYHKVEPALFALCSDRRITSRYSTICGEYWKGIDPDFKKFRKDLLSKMYLDSKPDIHDKEQIIRNHGSFAQLGNTIKSKKRHKYEKCRYKALNIHSYFMRGTIEFRHHEGTVDYNTITSWSLVCGHLVDAAAKMTDEQVDNLSNNPFEVLLSIIPENLHQYCKTKWKIFDDLAWIRYAKLFEDKFSTYNLTRMY